SARGHRVALGGAVTGLRPHHPPGLTPRAPRGRAIADGHDVRSDRRGVGARAVPRRTVPHQSARAARQSHHGARRRCHHGYAAWHFFALAPEGTLPPAVDFAIDRALGAVALRVVLARGL